jgi:hypothetical protein
VGVNGSGRVETVSLQFRLRFSAIKPIDRHAIGGGGVGGAKVSVVSLIVTAMVLKVMTVRVREERGTKTHPEDRFGSCSWTRALVTYRVGVTNGHAARWCSVIPAESGAAAGMARSPSGRSFPNPDPHLTYTY